MNRMVTNQIMPKLKLVSGMIAGALGVPANHPAVSRCLLSIIGPCGLLLITTPELQKQVFPSLSLDTPTLVEHMVTFALGGLKTISASVRPARQTRQART
jgi:hypothetical protein